MNKTKKNRKNKKTFRKVKKGGMDDDYLKYILEKEKNDKDIEKRKDMSTRRSRRKMSKSERNKNKKYITDLTRQLKELDINPSHKRTFDDTRGYYMHHHTRKSPKRTELPNYDKYSSNGDLSRKRSETLGGMEGDFNAEEWFKNVLEDSAGPFYEEVIFNRDYNQLTSKEKKAVKHYMQHVLTREEHDEMINRLEEKIKQIEIENRRLREIVLTQSFNSNKR